MTTLVHDILVRNGFVAVPANHSVESSLYAPIDIGVATVISNLASYGYTVDRPAYEALLSASDLKAWWKSTEIVLKEITGADRNMGDFIVYKNFPREVLDMTRAESVIKQILIYLGMPYDALREEEQERPPLGDIKRLKVLALADETTGDKIFGNLVAMRNRWSDNQANWAETLVGARNAIVCGDFGFKENAIKLAITNFETMEFVPSSATDVMRLAAGLSGADVSLREKVKFRHFKRAERRRLLDALETQTGIAEDMASRPEPWKRLIEHLRPGDYSSYGKVQSEFDALYNKQAKSFAALIDPQSPDIETLATVTTRPGEFVRRFHHFYGLFGHDAVVKLIGVMDKLSTRQLASLRGYLRTINTRVYMMAPPRGNWSKVKVRLNEKTKFKMDHLRMIDVAISKVLAERFKPAFPEGVALDMHVDNIRLQTNDQKLAEYGRGTEFEIPLEVKFIRSASYWAHGDRGVVWYDNGWNFFDDNWQPMGACCWNEQLHDAKAAVFSGDPVNIRDGQGRGCQMVDLYFDKLGQIGVRFAVWSILCYSRKPFSSAKEVLATLQMGENAETGKHYEPSRAQMVFPIKSETYVSYVAYVDVARRSLVYMDVALPGAVQSASMNAQKLSELMPAYVEYLESLPTVLEVLQDAPQGTMPVLYSDATQEIRDGRRAFVFKPENPQNSFERVSLTDLIGV